MTFPGCGCDAWRCQVSATVKLAVVLTAAMNAPACACRSRPNSTCISSGASASERSWAMTLSSGPDAADRFLEGLLGPFGDVAACEAACHSFWLHCAPATAVAAPCP